MLKRLFKRANNEAQPDPPSVGEIVAQPRADEVVEKPRVILKLILGVLGVVVIINLALAFYWSREPDMFNIEEAALKRAGGDANRLVPGYITAATLTEVAVSRMALKSFGLSRPFTTANTCTCRISV